jgi:hypothetical protein
MSITGISFPPIFHEYHGAPCSKIPLPIMASSVSIPSRGKNSIAAATNPSATPSSAILVFQTFILRYTNRCRNAAAKPSRFLPYTESAQVRHRIHMKNLLLCALLFATSSPRLLAQPPDHRYEALQQALALSDPQISQLRQQSPAPIPTDRQTTRSASRRAGNFGQFTPQQWDSSRRDRILDSSQQAKLVTIAKVLDRYELAALAITAGLIDAQEWPGATLCFYPISVSAAALALRDSQVQDLERLRQATPKPPRDEALAVLDDSQRANLAAFQTALQLARQAIELGLLPDPPKGEILCH